MNMEQDTSSRSDAMLPLNSGGGGAVHSGREQEEETVGVRDSGQRRRESEADQIKSLTTSHRFGDDRTDTDKRRTVLQNLTFTVPT